MSDTTVTVRGVDAKAWREFQAGIVSLHGNLYGNIGEELTNALTLWLEQYQGKEAAVSLPPERLPTGYADVGGLHEEAKMMREAVEMPLRHPELFRWLALIPPRGVLVYGPPGTGKNILARAAAAEAKARLYVLSLQGLKEEFHEQRLRGVFERAKETAPSVILIPDLAALTRSGDTGVEGSVPRILTALLSLMDALEDFARVVVIGIAASPEELEPTLRLRFQRRIQVSVPTKEARQEILAILTRKMPLAPDVDLSRLAALTDKYPGVMLLQMCQGAATVALRRTLETEKIGDEQISGDRLERVKVRMDDFLHALEAPKEGRDSA